MAAVRLQEIREPAWRKQGPGGQLEKLSDVNGRELMSVPATKLRVSQACGMLLHV